MQPETKMGPGAATPKPLCIAYLANALSQYAHDVIEGNQNSVSEAIGRGSGIRSVVLLDRTRLLAEAPENAL